MRYIRLSSKYGNLFLRKSKFEGVQFIQDENGEPRLGIVFGATTIAVDDTKENRKALRLPCQKDCRREGGKMNKLWKKANIPKTITTPRKIERRKEEIRMLQVNKKTFDEAQKITGLTTVAFAEKLGLKVRSYRSKKSDKSKNFTLKHILRAQDLSGIPIANFFIEKCHQNRQIK